MGRILCLDFGQKRTGIAVTDPLRIIANGLTTVDSKDVLTFLENYMKQEVVDVIVVGLPRQNDNTYSDSWRFVEPFLRRLKAKFPEMPVEMQDERFTSKMAHQTMIDAGLKRKARQNKELVDTISAAIILKSYLDRVTYNK